MAQQHINNIEEYQEIITGAQGEAFLWIESGFLHDSNDSTEIESVEQADCMILEWLNAVDPTGCDIDPDECSLPIQFDTEWRFSE